MPQYLVVCDQCGATAPAVLEREQWQTKPQEFVVPPQGWVECLVCPGSTFAPRVDRSVCCSFACLRAWASAQERLAARQAEAAQE